MLTLKQTPIHANYTLHGKQLTMVECAKYLGVSIDSKLSFNKHVDNLCKKANSVLSFVRRNFANCSREIKDVYLTYVKSTLEYAATAWAPYSRQSINKLESVQRRAAGFVMHDYNQTSSVSNMLLRLNWNTMETHFKHLRLQMLHKIIHSSVGVSLPSYITHRTRHTMPGAVTLNLYSQTQLLTHEYSFFPTSIRLWNNLSIDTLNCNNLDTFKEHLNSTRL